MNLPQEVIIDILSRLPIKSLLRFRCVCKSFYGLVTDPLYLNRVNQNSIKNTRLIVGSGSNPYNLYSFDYDPSDETPLNLNPLFNFPTPMMELVGSSNGFLCLFDSSISLRSDLFLLNPLTGEYKALPNEPVQFPRSLVSRFPVLGFGYSSKIDTYKVIRISYYYPTRVDWFLLGSYQSQVQVYTLATDSWRTIEGFDFDVRDQSSGILVNGVLHWMCTGSRSRSRLKTILCFDIGDEEFREITHPYSGFTDIRMNLGVLGGYLSVTCILSDCIEVWVMKESWTRWFQIEEQVAELFGNSKNLKTLGFLKNGQMLLQRNKGELVLYDPNSKWVGDITVQGIPGLFEASPYFGSFITIKP